MPGGKAGCGPSCIMFKEKDAETEVLARGKCHDGHRERMRQRYETTSLVGFHPHEVLELLLFDVIRRANTNGMAHAMLAARRDSLADVLSDPPDVHGIGDKAKEHLRALNTHTNDLLAEALTGPVGKSQLFTVATWHLRRHPDHVLLLLTDEEDHFINLELLPPTNVAAALRHRLSELPQNQIAHIAMRYRLDARTDLPMSDRIGMILLLNETWQGTWL